jgi:hypothetical protein
MPGTEARRKRSRPVWPLRTSRSTRSTPTSTRRANTTSCLQWRPHEGSPNGVSRIARHRRTHRENGNSALSYLGTCAVSLFLDQARSAASGAIERREEQFASFNRGDGRRQIYKYRRGFSGRSAVGRTKPICQVPQYLESQAAPDRIKGNSVSGHPEHVDVANWGLPCFCCGLRPRKVWWP